MRLRQDKSEKKRRHTLLQMDDGRQPGSLDPHALIEESGDSASTIMLPHWARSSSLATMQRPAPMVMGFLTIARCPACSACSGTRRAFDGPVSVHVVVIGRGHAVLDVVELENPFGLDESPACIRARTASNPVRDPAGATAELFETTTLPELWDLAETAEDNRGYRPSRPRLSAVARRAGPSTRTSARWASTCRRTPRTTSASCRSLRPSTRASAPRSSSPSSIAA